MKAVSSLHGELKILLSALTIFSPLFLLCGANVSANANRETVELWDRYGLSGYVEYTEGCKHEFASLTLEKCLIIISAPVAKIRPNRVSDDQGFYFMSTLKQHKTKTTVVFSKENSANGVREQYQVTITNGYYYKKYTFQLNTVPLANALRDNMLLILLSLALHPALQNHFTNYMTNYFLLNKVAGDRIEVSLQTLNLQDSRANEVLVDSGNYYAHGFRFRPGSQKLDRVVVHDQKAINQRLCDALSFGISVPVIVWLVLQLFDRPYAKFIAASFGVVAVALHCEYCGRTPDKKLILDIMRVTKFRLRAIKRLN